MAADVRCGNPNLKRQRGAATSLFIPLRDIIWSNA